MEEAKGLEELTARLLAVDVSGMIEKKGKLSYLSWAHALKSILKECPGVDYEVLINDELGLPVFGNKAMGWMVYTTVTIADKTRKCWLPVMDHKNNAVLEPDMMQINKTAMRCLTKNLSMFGLGIDIYAGDDLPAGDGDDGKKPDTSQGQQSSSNKSDGKISEKQVGFAVKLVERSGMSEAEYKALLKEVGKTDVLADMHWKCFNDFKEACEAKATAKSQDGAAGASQDPPEATGQTSEQDDFADF